MYHALAMLAVSLLSNIIFRLMAVSSLFARPLHIAAQNGLVSVVQELISKGASLLALDNKGENM